MDHSFWAEVLRASVVVYLMNWSCFERDRQLLFPKWSVGWLPQCQYRKRTKFCNCKKCITWFDLGSGILDSSKNSKSDSRGLIFSCLESLEENDYFRIPSNSSCSSVFSPYREELNWILLVIKSEECQNGVFHICENSIIAQKIVMNRSIWNLWV